METAAQKFEQEDGILKEVQAQMSLGDDSLHSTLFASTEDDEYRPYCKIEFEGDIAGWEQVKRSTSSSLGPDERSFLPKGGALSGEARCIKKEPSQRVSVHAYCPEELTPSDKYIAASSTTSLDRSASLDNDDSEMEIFRVKRRSPICGEKREDSDMLNSKVPAQKVH